MPHLYFPYSGLGHGAGDRDRVHRGQHPAHRGPRHVRQDVRHGRGASREAVESGLGRGGSPLLVRRNQDVRDVTVPQRRHARHRQQRGDRKDVESGQSAQGGGSRQQKQKGAQYSNLDFHA